MRLLSKQLNDQTTVKRLGGYTVFTKKLNHKTTKQRLNGYAE